MLTLPVLLYLCSAHFGSLGLRASFVDDARHVEFVGAVVRVSGEFGYARGRCTVGVAMQSHLPHVTKPFEP